ncbi:MAG TPA: hypothetical protein VF483_06365 [Gemmatimonadaceae bacterium]
MIGFAAVGNSLTASLLTAGVVRWSGEARVDGRDVVGAFRATLEKLPPVKGRTRVLIGLDNQWAQVRNLRELPVASDADIKHVVAEGAERFFLRKGVNLVTTGVLRTGTASGVGAAFEKPLVDDLADACRSRGMTLAAVLPMCAIEPHSKTDGKGLAIASAVAQLSDRHPLAYRLPRVRRAVTIREFVAAVVVLAASVAVLAGGRQIGRMLYHWHHGDAAGAPGRMGLADLMDSRARARALSLVASNGRSVTVLLAAIAATLPEGSVLKSVQADAAGATVALVTPDAAAALRAIGHVPDVTGATIVGPTTLTADPGAARRSVNIHLLWNRGHVTDSSVSATRPSLPLAQLIHAQRAIVQSADPWLFKVSSGAATDTALARRAQAAAAASGAHLTSVEQLITVALGPDLRSSRARLVVSGNLSSILAFLAALEAPRERVFVLEARLPLGESERSADTKADLVVAGVVSDRVSP